jgi:hypothetical protein
VSLHGNTLTVTVLNIGSAPSGEFSIDVRRPNTGVLRTLRVGSIPGSNDFTPKKTTVIVPDLPAPPPYHICVDPSNTVKEIFEENNSAVAAGNPQLGE